MSQACDILDINLADEGQKRILWADRDMPVLARIRERFAEERPLEGVDADSVGMWEMEARDTPGASDARRAVR